MSDISFPQIPSTVWWGMRNLLINSPRATFDESMISAKLGVQQAAARQYVAELKKVGILDDEGKGTDLANRWRMDDSYSEAVKDIANKVYPSSLVTIAPPGAADRQTVKNWFMTQGLGAGSAGNKTATYLLLTSELPEDSAQTKTTKVPASSEKAPSTSKKSSKLNPGKKELQNTKENNSDSLPLNVNVQVHISADASTEQIDAIFSAMRKYRIGS